MTGEVVLGSGEHARRQDAAARLLQRLQREAGPEFMIDVQTKRIGDLKPGTVLTATVTTTTQTCDRSHDRAASRAEVWWVQGTT